MPKPPKNRLRFESIILIGAVIESGAPRLANSDIQFKQDG
jgi:hypothetical protein